MCLLSFISARVPSYFLRELEIRASNLMFRCAIFSYVQNMVKFLFLFFGAARFANAPRPSRPARILSVLAPLSDACHLIAPKVLSLERSQYREFSFLGK